MISNLVTFDCEVSPNFFLICFKSISTEKILSIHTQTVLSSNDKEKIKTIFSCRTTFGFNCSNYDLPIIIYALQGASTAQIYQMSKNIIEKKVPSWKILKQYNLVIPRHWLWFDLQEVAGHKLPLKLYGARLHSKLITELPYDPHLNLTPEQISNLIVYCKNDLALNIELYNYLKPQFALREHMSKIYNQNLMSKSDAQIAESIIKSELKLSKQLAPGNLSDIKYVPPKFIKFESASLNALLDKITSLEFQLDSKGLISLPSELSIPIKIGNSTYQMGVGGLHSCEKSIFHVANDDYEIYDKDVTSYYPSIILNCKYYPRQLGVEFLNLYKSIVDERIAAKKKGDKVTSDALKIVINGTFGKLGSQYSVLYSPDLLLQVTLTGQLALLMLIEFFEMYQIKVISANTDGVVIYMPKKMSKWCEMICWDWEFQTGFNLESTQYKALYSRDVNNYLAIKLDNTTKGKGIFAEDGLSKNPQAPIIYKAACELLAKGITIENTIKNCKDISRFIMVRRVNGGAKWKDKHIGKIARWIFVTNGSSIYYEVNGHKVPSSENSEPVTEMGEVPKNIDYEYYIENAYKLLGLIGVTNAREKRKTN